MKKITVLVPATERDNFLSALRKEEVLHIKHIKAPSHEDLLSHEELSEKINEAVNILSNYGSVENSGHAGSVDEAAESEKAAKIIKAFYDREELQDSLALLDSYGEWFDKWGKVNSGDILVLREKGINLKLYEAEKAKYKKIKDKYDFKVISESKKTVCLALISSDGGVIDDLEEVTPPPIGFDGWVKKREDIKRRADGLLDFLKNNAAWLAGFIKLGALLEKKKEFLTVRAGMLDEGAFLCVQGFCPLGRLDNIVRLSKLYKAGYLIENPDSPEETPTLIKNPKWIEIINPVFSFMNTVPGYDEFDISLVFLAFFSLFFAILVGDAGYGIIFLTLTVLARKKFKKAPGGPFFLMYLLSVSTIIWGAITGTWFGYEGLAKTGILSNFVIERINSFVDSNQDFMMFICFLIGAVHLTIAHTIRAVRQIKSLTWIAEAGWVAIIWGMFYLAGALVISRPFPEFAGALIGGGAFVVLVFANFQKNIIKGMAETLTNLPLSVIAAFSDVVSYLRLFAVGYASVIVAASFNNMAIGSGITSVIGGLAAAFILFFGHTLNIVLALMAVVVHGIRLNMLEFSGHLGMQWSGKEYKPFSE